MTQVKGQRHQWGPGGVPDGEFVEYFCVLDSQFHLQFIIIIIKILIDTFLYGREVVSSEVCKTVEI